MTATTRPRLNPAVRAQVLELRRTQSATAVAKALSLPLGTVKTIASRAGITRDNQRLREFFRLPEPVLSDCTELATPAAPPEAVKVTGDREMDAVLWLREVVKTGDPDLIEKAREAAARIKTPAKELESRYAQFLMTTTGNSMVAAFGSIGFTEINRLADGVIERQGRKRNAVARYGSEEAVFADTPQESFCKDALLLVPQGDGGWNRYEKNAALVDRVFDQCADLVPYTLSDCLFETDFWDSLYRLRSAWENSGDHWPEVTARTDYLWRCMSRIKPKSRAEAKEVLRYLAGDEDRLGYSGADAILENLIG